MHINFASPGWETALPYAYSWRSDDVTHFDQHADHIANRANPALDYGWESTSLLSAEAYAPGVTLTTRCAFEGLGAPLITIAKAIDTDDRGVRRYGEYMEIVLYKNGVNVWRMWRDASVAKNGGVWWKKLMGVEFPVTEGDAHTLSVKVLADSLNIDADGHRMSVFIPDMYPSFHVGIDACEGLNRFWSFSCE